MSGRASPSRASATMRSATRTAIDRRAAADPVEDARAAQLREHPERRLAIDRGEADRHVVEQLREHAPEPDDDRRPERRDRGGARRSARRRGRPSARRGGRATTRPWARAAASSSSPAASDRRIAERARARTRPRSLLCARSERVDLQRDGAARRTLAPPRRRRRRPARPMASVTGQAGLAQQLQALALGQGAGRAGRLGDPRPGRGRRRPLRARRPSGPRPVPASPAAMAPVRAGAVRARSQRATDAIAVNASSAPRSSGAPSPCSSSTAFVSGGGSPDVNDTYTGRMCGRSRVAARSWRVTSFAVATSAGIDLYGKSCTSTRTS